MFFCKFVTVTLVPLHSLGDKMFLNSMITLAIFSFNLWSGKEGVIIEFKTDIWISMLSSTEVSWLIYTLSLLSDLLMYAIHFIVWTLNIKISMVFKAQVRVVGHNPLIVYCHFHTIYFIHKTGTTFPDRSSFAERISVDSSFTAWEKPFLHYTVYRLSMTALFN